MDEKEFDTKISWLDKGLMMLFPHAAIRRIGKKMGIENSPFEAAHLLFDGVARVDVLPLAGDRRGFMLVLDRNTALYFYQEGDGFAYDGFELGEYRVGDVFIFERSP